MRSLLTLLALALAAGPARAHFIYLIPSPDQKSATMVFSDTLGPDERVSIDKIAKTKLHALDATGKSVAVEMAAAKHHIEVKADGKQPLMIGGVCEYGVSSRTGKPFLLMYYPKTMLGRISRDAEPAWLAKGSKQLPLEIVKAEGKLPRLQVLFQGKPLAGAEAAIIFDGEESEEIAQKSDAKGQIDIAPILERDKDFDLAGIRVKHVEKKSGDLDGKKYGEIRHYATLVGRSGVRHIEKEAKDAPPPQEEVSFRAGDKNEDPAASKLLADARAARALWHKFPGFSAQVEINEDGKKIPCRLIVSPEGRVTLEPELADLDGKQADLLKKVRGEITSLVAHRMPGGPTDTPAAFADDVKDHPQGRLIHILNDELHSSYRIRDRQILEVNRDVGPGGRFTITVLENVWNKEKTYLPAFYVVNSWDKAGQLRNSTAHRNTWVRLGAFDLPQTATSAASSSTGLSVRTITFSGHKLGADALRR